MHKEFIDPKLLKLLTTFDSQLDDCDYGKYGGIKYFCHEYMRNHYLFNISEFSTTKDITYFLSHEKSMANIIVRAGKFRNSISEARRNGWNREIPMGFSDHKSSGKVKNSDIYILNTPEPYDLNSEMEWCIAEGDVIGFLSVVFYDIVLLMKRMSAELSISNSVNMETIYREFRKSNDISCFLRGCRNAPFINISQRNQNLIDSLNIRVSDVIEMGINFILEYVFSINKILILINDESKENIFEFSQLY